MEIFHLLHGWEWSPSPHIYRGEPPSPQPGNRHIPPWTTNRGQPRGAWRRWGPWAGRPTTPLGPPTFPFFVWAVLQAHLSLDCVSVFVLSVPFSGGPSNPCDARVAVWLDGVLLLRWNGYDCPSFLAKTCTHRILEGHVEFGDLLAAWV